LTVIKNEVQRGNSSYYLACKQSFCRWIKALQLLNTHLKRSDRIYFIWLYFSRSYLDIPPCKKNRYFLHWKTCRHHHCVQIYGPVLFIILQCTYCLRPAPPKDSDIVDTYKSARIIINNAVIHLFKS